MVSLQYMRALPARENNARRLELVRPGSARKFSLSTAAALEYVYDGPRRTELGGLIGESREAAESDDGNFDRWIERNWAWCAPYYLFSRRSDYADADDADGEIRRRVLGTYLAGGDPPQPPHTGTPLVHLDHRDVSAKLDVGGTLAARRSVPRPRRRPFSSADLGWVLFTGCARMRAALARQASAAEDPLALLTSFGSALDVYVVAYAVDGLTPGVYRYDVAEDGLGPLPGRPSADALRRRMAAILVGQPAPLSAAATVVLVADFERYQWRYRHERALRHLWLDAAHAMGYLLFSATALRKSTHISPAARDSQGNAFLGLSDARHQIMYSLSTG
ncbi:SagB/ThcOx family dehydrogenase [Streptomyces longisporoflavus]|uniref:SagB/ThcOx family dehydrogenase n=1 Tax=Streptomyces longisporoflavus TaxID=28044 RepID=A0ABW7QPH9_9ACTN